MKIISLHKQKQKYKLQNKGGVTMDPEEEQKKQEKGFLEKSKNELKRSRERAEKQKKQ